MPFLRRHSNRFHVIVAYHGEEWVVYSRGDAAEVTQLTASTLEEAKGIADSLAAVSHAANDECNESCKEWVTY